MSSDGRLQGEVAVVVGAGSSGDAGEVGIGKAIAMVFASEGAQVVLVDNVLARAEETHERIAEAGGQSTVVQADISDPSSAARIVEAAVSNYGTVSVLVNNAAYTPLLTVADTSPELFAKVLAVNVIGTFSVMQAALPVMVERGGGSIVNIGSVSSLRSTTGYQTAYASSKAALLGLMVDVANEHGRNNIRVNTISPGMIDTPIRRATMRDRGLDPETVPFGPQCSLGHSGEPWDIARAALFLASGESKFITGVHLPVDGGLTTRQPTS